MWSKVILKTIYYLALDYLYAFYWLAYTARHPHPPKSLSATSSPKPPIIMIPGVYEAWAFMLPIARSLEQAGYSIYFIDALSYNTAEIPVAAKALDNLLQIKNLRNAILVAHSKGGLIGKYSLVYGAAERIEKLIAINTPFAGSSRANWFWIKTIRAFAPTNAIIQDLLAKTAANHKIISIYSRYDLHIPGTSHLSGAKNIVLPLVGHFRILNAFQAKRLVETSISETSKIIYH